MTVTSPQSTHSHFFPHNGTKSIIDSNEMNCITNSVDIVHKESTTNAVLSEIIDKLPPSYKIAVGAEIIAFAPSVDSSLNDKHIDLDNSESNPKYNIDNNIEGLISLASSRDARDAWFSCRKSNRSSFTDIIGKSYNDVSVYSRAPSFNGTINTSVNSVKSRSVFSKKNSLQHEEYKSIVRKFYYQLSVGCQHDDCEFRLCKTAKRDVISSETAAILSLELASKYFSNNSSKNTSANSENISTKYRDSQFCSRLPSEIPVQKISRSYLKSASTVSNINDVNSRSLLNFTRNNSVSRPKSIKKKKAPSSNSLYSIDNTNISRGSQQSVNMNNNNPLRPRNAPNYSPSRSNTYTNDTSGGSRESLRKVLVSSVSVDSLQDYTHNSNEAKNLSNISINIDDNSLPNTNKSVLRSSTNSNQTNVIFHKQTNLKPFIFSIFSKEPFLSLFFDVIEDEDARVDSAEFDKKTEKESLSKKGKNIIINDSEESFIGEVHEEEFSNLGSSILFPSSVNKYFKKSNNLKKESSLNDNISGQTLNNSDRRNFRRSQSDNFFNENITNFDVTIEQSTSPIENTFNITETSDLTETNSTVDTQKDISISLLQNAMKPLNYFRKYVSALRFLQLNTKPSATILENNDENEISPIDKLNSPDADSPVKTMPQKDINSSLYSSLNVNSRIARHQSTTNLLGLTSLLSMQDGAGLEDFSDNKLSDSIYELSSNADLAINIDGYGNSTDVREKRNISINTTRLQNSVDRETHSILNVVPSPTVGIKSPIKELFTTDNHLLENIESEIIPSPVDQDESVQELLSRKATNNEIKTNDSDEAKTLMDTLKDIPAPHELTYIDGQVLEACINTYEKSGFISDNKDPSFLLAVIKHVFSNRKVLCRSFLLHGPRQLQKYKDDDSLGFSSELFKHSHFPVNMIGTKHNCTILHHGIDIIDFRRSISRILSLEPKQLFLDALSEATEILISTLALNVSNVFNCKLKSGYVNTNFKIVDNFGLYLTEDKTAEKVKTIDEFTYDLRVFVYLFELPFIKSSVSYEQTDYSKPVDISPFSMSPFSPLNLNNVEDVSNLVSHSTIMEGLQRKFVALLGSLKTNPRKLLEQWMLVMDDKAFDSIILSLKKWLSNIPTVLSSTIQEEKDGATVGCIKVLSVLYRAYEIKLLLGLHIPLEVYEILRDRKNMSKSLVENKVPYPVSINNKKRMELSAYELSLIDEQYIKEMADKFYISEFDNTLPLKIEYLRWIKIKYDEKIKQKEITRYKYEYRNYKNQLKTYQHMKRVYDEWKKQQETESIRTIQSESTAQTSTEQLSNHERIRDRFTDKLKQIQFVKKNKPISSPVITEPKKSIFKSIINKVKPAATGSIFGSNENSRNTTPNSSQISISVTDSTPSLNIKSADPPEHPGIEPSAPNILPAKYFETIQDFSFLNFPFLLSPQVKMAAIHRDAIIQMTVGYENAFVNQSLILHAQRFVGISKDAGHSESNNTNSSNNAAIDSGEVQNTNIASSSLSISSSESGELIDDYASNAVTIGTETIDKFESSLKKIGVTNPFLVFEVSRERLIDDVLEQLSILSKRKGEYKKPLKIRFINEQGQDQGGVQKEFFQILIDKLIDPNYELFTYNNETRTSHINGFSLESDRKFELFGYILGLALYNGIIVGVKFSSYFYKVLLGEELLLSDLQEAYPSLGKGLQQLLDWYDPTYDVSDIFLRTFEISYEIHGNVKHFPLVRNGSEILVTNETREQYVRLYIDHFLFKSKERQFSALSRGFWSVVGDTAKNLCRYWELEWLLCGNEMSSIDFKELEEGCGYDDGYERNTEVVDWFWSIVHDEMDIETKKKLLNFVTASDRVPLGGLSKLNFIIQRNGPDSDRLPTALTCFGRLLLPEYSSKEKLRTYINIAIKECKGFGLI